MSAYFLPAAGFAGVKRPTIIFTNGYDGTITDMYFASAVAASRGGLPQSLVRRAGARRDAL